jgi:single-stranded-DNA-specific exonuclease
MSRAVRVVCEPRLIKERHLKFRFRQGDDEHEGIHFNGAGNPLPKQPWDIAYTIDRSQYRGREQVSLIVQAVRGGS